ncbi:hypothetical protein [Pseudoteredinibacter isoporae]|uniref:hypothetical protein n=1 Tax=Pseudoteredinibacter isoporae TaxID=570281 RepID=UPI0033414420
MKKSAFTLLMLLILTSTSSNAETSASESFAQMKNLVGIWTETEKPNSKFSIEFSLVSNNSVLVETWRRGTKKHSLTLYHLDGKNLIATHYCPQGNQPRLQMTPNSTKKKLSFSYRDATNLSSLDHSHQHSLAFVLPNKSGQLIRQESYLSGAGEKFSTLHLSKKQASPSPKDRP